MWDYGTGCSCAPCKKCCSKSDAPAEAEAGEGLEDAQAPAELEEEKVHSARIETFFRETYMPVLEKGKYYFAGFGTALFIAGTLYIYNIYIDR